MTNNVNDLTTKTVNKCDGSISLYFPSNYDDYKDYFKRMKDIQTTKPQLNRIGLYLTGNDAREELTLALQNINKVVSSSYGCDGLLTLIPAEQGVATNTMSDDGFTILTKYPPTNEIEVEAKRILYNATSVTNHKAGDSTTLTTMLSTHFGCKTLELTSNGKSKFHIRSAIDSLLPKLLKELKKNSYKLKKKEDYYALALISSKDEAIAKVVSDVYWECSQDMPFVTRNDRPFLEKEIVHGIVIPHKYCHSAFVDKNLSIDKEVKLTNSTIIATSRKVDSLTEFQTLLGIAQNTQTDVVMIAKDFDNNILINIGNLYNDNTNQFKIYPISLDKAGFLSGEKQNIAIKDICANLGTTMIDTVNTGVRIESIIETEEMYKKYTATCSSITINQNNIFFDTTNGNKEVVASRMNEVDTAFKNPEYSADADTVSFLILRKRLLSSKLSVIKVGASTQTEVDFLFSKIDDAKAVIMSAIDYGFVLGGTKTLIQVHKALLEDCTELEREYLDCLLEPTKTLCRNSMIEEGLYEPISSTLRDENSQGYDFSKHEFVDLYDAKIFDSYKAVYQAITNSMSVAKSLMIETIYLNNKFNIE